MQRPSNRKFHREFKIRKTTFEMNKLSARAIRYNENEHPVFQLNQVSI
jgi:hypothetical protein